MKTLIVHPDDLNLADVKAKAAELGVTAVGDKYIPTRTDGAVRPGRRAGRVALRRGDLTSNP